MANWEPLERTLATAAGLKSLEVLVEVRLIGGKPFYRAKLGNYDYANIIKVSNSNSCNAKFSWERTFYYLSVPYWD